MNKKNIPVSYFEEKIETMPHEDLNILMLERLKKTLKYVYQNVPFYKEKFDDAGVNANIDLIKNMKDLQNFPFTFKSDLVNNYPFGLFSSPLTDIVRIHASSGTTAKPIIASYTKKDLKVWADLMSRVFYACGLNKNDIAQNAYGYGLFTGGLGFHYGAENIGMTVVPMSSGFTERQFAMMKDIGVTALFCTPSYALFLSEELPKYIEDVSKLKLKKGIFGAEPWSNELRIKIENLLNIDAYDIYGLSELIGPGVAFECEYKSGLHINEDNFYPEIIDPKTGDILPEGELGELVLTNLNQEAMPLIRYRTRDITSLNREKCKCGRTFARMKKIKGRTDDMIIIKGVNVFPSQIESVIFDFDFLEPVYMIELYTDNLLDRINILIETKAEIYNIGDKKLDEITSMLQYKIHELIGIKSKVTIVPPKTLERSQGKSKRIKDLRKKL
ncbi:MAG: phenylacetate--CoA ligase [Candidatus Acididesulfobacter diazotrophicus]|uniref:Phenylacetate-coenzyme A ligase n=1 Tax=Candidatus Acididesulfobacter diazotrophicus TaxID=2597226 RepID=A0A519BKK5_9DELT|nr:MAG: phenylacetate--CoA ligase [Candidatus Acididesulfobacter diazotrophicus]